MKLCALLSCIGFVGHMANGSLAGSLFSVASLSLALTVDLLGAP